MGTALAKSGNWLRSGILDIGYLRMHCIASGSHRYRKFWSRRRRCTPSCRRFERGRRGCDSYRMKKGNFAPLPRYKLGRAAVQAGAEHTGEPYIEPIRKEVAGQRECQRAARARIVR